MSHYPNHGPPHGHHGPPHGHHGPPPPYYGPPTHWHPHQPHPQMYPPHDGGQVTAPGSYPYYVPGAIMVPVPMPPMAPADTNQPTYITNYIYHGESSNPPSDQGQVVETSGEFDWVPTTATTASHLTGKAVVGGHEGWDGSPLWVIRAWHNGDLIPGKFSIRHNAASIMYSGKEIGVQNIEVLVARPENLRWIPASNGNIPPGAIPGGRTSSGETLYVGRARHQLSITPGKVHPSHNSCYISFAGSEVAYKIYDVLCRIS